MHDFGLDREHMQVPQGNLDPSCCEATKRKKEKSIVNHAYVLIQQEALRDNEPLKTTHIA